MGSGKIGLTFSFRQKTGGGVELVHGQYGVPPTPGLRRAGFPDDGWSTGQQIAAAAVGSALVGWGIRALKEPGIPRPEIKDLMLDAAVGVQLAGVSGHPAVERAALAGWATLPLQMINARKGQWDGRIGVLTQGLVAGGTSLALGRDPIPFKGWEEPRPGEVRLKHWELAGNVATELAFDATKSGAANYLAARLQGYRGDDARSFLRTGVYYGAATSAVENLLLGPPVRLDDSAMRAEIARVQETMGIDLTRAYESTTFRTGGLLFGLNSFAGITLGHNVAMKPSRLADETLGIHEVGHRYQIEQMGPMNFYASYVEASLLQGVSYEDLWHEQHAETFEDGSSAALSGSPSTHGSQLATGASLLLGIVPLTLWGSSEGKIDVAELDTAVSVPEG